MGSNLVDRLCKVSVLALDVDGVLTDGKIVIDAHGEELKFYDVKDGFGIYLWHQAGLKTAIITARSSKPVEARAADLKIHLVYQDAYPKLQYYEKMLAEFGVSAEEVCFIGDDLTDLELIRRSGLGAAPANAAEEVRCAAGYVCARAGGDGAVREVIELILKAQNKWEHVIASF